MRVIRTVLVCLLLLSLAVARAAPDASPCFDIPKLANIVIDGAGADWGDDGFRVDQLLAVTATNAPGPLVSVANHAARFRLGWDDAGLLLLAEVLDDRWVEDAQDDRLYQGDAVTLYLAPARGAVDTCQWVIAPGMRAEDDAPRTRFYNYRHTEALKGLPATLEVARTAIPGGVRIEARVPWSALAIRPAVGREVAFECWSHDLDDPRATGHRLTWYPLLGAFSDSTRMYRLRLAEQAGPPVLGRAFAAYADNQPRITVIAPAEQAGKTVQVLSGTSVVQQDTLTSGDLGLAATTLALTRARSGAPDGAYTVVLDGIPIETVTFPKSDRLDAIDRLLARAAFLRAHFNLDQPWDAMADAPALIRRHRGIVALALHWLNNRTWMLDDEERQDALAALAAMIDAVDRGRDALAEQRGNFWAAYYSRADGSGQPFVVMLPDGFDPRASYPLVVKLHGMGSRPVPEGPVLQAPFILVRPWGRGENFYQALGEDDVLQVIATMREWYHIDPDRIYLTGGSMGGTGTWNLACRYPDRFAAAVAYCGTTIGPFLENLRNLPLCNQHGGKDMTVPVDMSRYGMARLAQLGYGVTYREFADATHDLQGLPSAPWLLQHQRVAAPAAVTLTFDELAVAGAYWLRVHAVDDPHRRTTLQAAIAHGPAQTLTMTAPNATVIELDIARMPVDRAQALRIEVEATVLTLPSPLPAASTLVRRDGAWSLVARWTPPMEPRRPYAPGGAAELFTGESLLIVYGTGGTAARTALWRGAAERLSSFAGAHGSAVGRLPMKADAAVTPADLTHYNLILLGGPGDNAVVARMLPRLPVTLTSDGLRAGERPPVSLRHAGWGLAYFNPLAPARAIYLLACDASDRELEAWLRTPADLLIGARGIDRIAQPDLYVQEVRGPLRRLMQFTTGWRWRAVPGAERPLPAQAATAAGAQLARLRTLRRAAGADIALGEGAGAERIYDPAWITAADIATQTAPLLSLTCRLTGRELQELQRSLPGELTLLTDGAPLHPARAYRVVMPPHLCKPLGQQRRAPLPGVDAGPQVSAEAVWAEIMQ